MGSGLFGFVFNTLQKRVNDPSNSKFWLPGRLSNLPASGGPGKLLPLKEDSWDLGTISGTAGSNFQKTIMDQWWLGPVGLDHKGDPELTKHQPIGCPDNPFPRLTLNKITIFGLDNVYVAGNPKTSQTAAGYHSAITLRSGHYDGRDNRPKLSPLVFDGDYSLKQCVCSAPADAANAEACDNWVPTYEVDGVGHFNMTFTDTEIQAEVDLQVQGTGGDRRVTVIVDKLDVVGTGPDNLPVLTVNSLDVQSSWTWMADNMWVPKAKQAFESHDGVKGLVKNLTDSLNSPDNKIQLQNMLNDKFQDLLDDVFGDVAPAELPSGADQPGVNPVDQYVFDRVRYALGSPSSNFYLPKAIYRFSDPQLEPYRIAEVALGDLEIPGLFTCRNFTLENVVIVGLSNMRAPADSMVLKQASTDMRIDVSALNPPPTVTVNGSSKQVPAPPLKITGNFSLNVPGESTPLGGGFSITIQTSNVNTTATFCGSELSDLVITFSKIVLSARDSDIHVVMDIQSAFKDIINQAANGEGVKNKLMTALNGKAAQSLSDIGAFATKDVKQYAAQQLDG